MPDASTPAWPTEPASAPRGEGRLALHLRSVGQLVALDGAWPDQPGCPRPAAEAAMMDWARQQPAGVPLVIVVHLPADAAGDAEAHLLQAGLVAHFRRLLAEQERLVAEHLKDARRSLAVGIAILVACLTAAWWLATALPDWPFPRVLRESVGILGWVAMWKPVEMLLHDRRPILRRKRLLQRLAGASVQVVTGEAGAGGPR